MKDLLKSFFYFFESILNLFVITTVSLIFIVYDQLKVAYRCFKECKSFRDPELMRKEIAILKQKLRDLDEH